MPVSDTATITSDELEVVSNGAKTIFRGHVILTQSAYVLTSDQMVQNKPSDIVEAEGHVVGVWVKPTGEKIIAQGKRARYNPNNQTTELWEGSPRLTRWETARDTTPVVVTARRFIAHHDDRVLLAENDVHIQQGASFAAHSDEAKYVDKEQAIYLWGTKKTAVDWQDAQGNGHFLSDRAELYLQPRRIRMVDHVTGHVVPEHS